MHGTLAHMLGAEWLWLERWRGGSPTAVPARAAWHTVADLEAAWAPVRDGQRAFLAGLHPAELERVVAYRTLAGAPRAYPLVEVLVHGASHSTYHRGQVSAMLRQLGATPPATDYVLFLDERRP